MPTVLITGANRGIGLALARHYWQHHCSVIGVCRQSDKALEACCDDVIGGIDLQSDDAVRCLTDALADRRIDLLISNAGILQDEQLGSLDIASIEQQFQVNALGPLRLVSALQANLSVGSKIALITSRMGSIEDNTSGGRYGYRMSKAALNMGVRCLAIECARWRQAPVVVAVHPGTTETNLSNAFTKTRKAPVQSAAACARQLKVLVESLVSGQSGQFLKLNGQTLPW